MFKKNYLSMWIYFRSQRPRIASQNPGASEGRSILDHYFNQPVSSQ
jgi:hypothetical protein